MGEAKRKRRRHELLLKRCPTCIYCGGVEEATTVDHMPPIRMFHGRHRPKGLEFAACEHCNLQTRMADLVASLIGRLYPDPTKEEHEIEVREILSALGNNLPGAIEEMYLSEADQERQRDLTGLNIEGGFVRVDGPLVSRQMQMFAVKFGFALHYEATGQTIPKEGGVAARWFSNVEQAQRRFPDSIVEMLPPPRTLRQGTKGVPEQFLYSYGCTQDASLGLYMGTFRQSFAIVAFAAKDRSVLLSRAPDVDGFRVYAPGEVLAI